MHETNCIENYYGVSGGMEVQEILDMLQQLQASHNIRYKYFLGDGDTEVEENLYGSNFSIEKLEYVGHV